MPTKRAVTPDVYAFTLIELLVAVGLMVLLVAIVVTVFYQTTEVFRRTQSKMEIYQNARYALNTISKDLAATLAYDVTRPFVINTPPPVNVGGIDIRIGLYLSFVTTASFIDPAVANIAESQRTGIVRVAYRLINRTNNNANRNILCRELFNSNYDILSDLTARPTNTTSITGQAHQDELCEYVRELQVSYLTWYMNNNSPLPNDSFDRFAFVWPQNLGAAAWSIDGALNRAFMAATDAYNNSFVNFNGQDLLTTIGNIAPASLINLNRVANNVIPSLIRITMTVTDPAARETRLFTRSIWIPTSVAKPQN